MVSKTPMAAVLGIATDHLLLRPIELGDAAATAAIIPKAIAEWLPGWQPCMRVSAVAALIAQYRSDYVGGRRIDWAIFLKPDLGQIGWVGLARPQHGTAPPPVSCWLGEQFRGMGYRHEAIAAAANYASVHFNYPIEAVSPRSPEATASEHPFQLGILNPVNASSADLDILNRQTARPEDAAHSLRGVVYL